MTKILLVDDVRLFVELERSFLKRSGCQVYTARSGVEALEQARAHRPDLVLLDAQMPGMDGQTCCRALKADPALQHIPVILLAGALDLEGCIEAGGDGIVRRPFTRDQLLAEIRRFIPLAERSCERLSVSFKVDYRRGDLEGFGYTKDLCEAGLFVKSQESLEPGDALELTFSLPLAEPRPVRTAGHVVRTVKADRDSHLIPGFGVQFDDLSAQNGGTISHFVRERVG